MSQMHNILPVGIDLGTSSIKISVGEKKYRIPSLIGEPNPGFKGIVADKSWINNLVVTLDSGEEYYIGELARLQSMVKIPLAREGKMKSAKDVMVAIKASLGLICERSEQTFVIATGVPVATGRNEMEALSKSIIGFHNVVIKNDATGEVKKIRAKVLAAPVMPEPYGAWYHLLKMKGEEKAVDTVIIDIGYGSTDILTVYNGNIMRPASGSITEAVDTLVTKVAQFLTDKTGKMVKPEALIATLEKGKTTVAIGGTLYDIKPQIDATASYVVLAIIDEVERLMGNLPPDAMIRYFIIEGGGVYYFGEKIKEALLDKGFIRSLDQVLIPEEPVLANAMGFELIAQYYARKILQRR